MKRNPTMIGIEATVAMAAKAMCQEEVGSVIILDHNKPIGIVTEEDINCKVVAKDLKPSKVHVNEIMSTPLITVSADKTFGDAAHMMVKHKVRRLPVVDEQQQGDRYCYGPGSPYRFQLNSMTFSKISSRSTARRSLSRGCAIAAARCLMTLSGWTV